MKQEYKNWVSTKISYSIPKPGLVILKIYDIADTTKYSKQHLRKRLKVFDNEDFLYKEVEI